MSKFDLIISIILHVALIATFAIASPFKPNIDVDLGEVMRVNLAPNMPMPSEPIQQRELKPVEIPAPQMADEPVVDVIEVASATEAAIIEKPKPKPKEKEKYQPQADKSDKDQPGQEDGPKDVSENLGTGSKFAGATIDNASFTYPYWFTQAFSKIERNWTNPVYANTELQCTIYFQVIRSGRIIKTEIRESSGIPAYDKACVRAVELAQPLPPLPDSFTEEIIGINLIFPYMPG